PGDDRHEEDELSLEISPDEKSFLVGSGHEMTLWPVDRGGPRELPLDGDERVTSVHFLPGGRALSSSFSLGSRRVGRLQLWDLDAGRVLKVLEGHGGRVNDTTVSTDGRRALSGSWDKTTRLWDLETGLTVATLSGSGVRAVRAASFLAGNRAVTVG